MLNELPLDCSPALVRVIKTTSAVKNLQQLAQDADLALLQVWGAVSGTWNSFNSRGVFYLCASGFLWCRSTSVLLVWAECAEKAQALECGERLETWGAVVRRQCWISDRCEVAGASGGLGSMPLRGASPLKQAAQELLRLNSEYLQGWRSHSLSASWSGIWPASEWKAFFIANGSFPSSTFVCIVSRAIAVPLWEVSLSSLCLPTGQLKPEQTVLLTYPQWSVLVLPHWCLCEWRHPKHKWKLTAAMAKYCRFLCICQELLC